MVVLDTNVVSELMLESPRTQRSFMSRRKCLALVLLIQPTPPP